jgi:hypothetical protein
VWLQQQRRRWTPPAPVHLRAETLAAPQGGAHRATPLCGAQRHATPTVLMAALQAQLEATVALLRTGSAQDARSACRLLLGFQSQRVELAPAAAGDKEAAGAAGALPAVVCALRAHADDTSVQLEGCKALLRLCRIHALNSARAGEAGAVDAVLKAAAHAVTSGDPDKRLQLSMWAFCALRWLVLMNADNAKAAVTAGALESVVVAMRADPTSRMMQCAGCHCIGAMAKSDANVRSRAIQAGAIEVVLTAMRMHESNILLIRAACPALRFLYGFERVVKGSTEARAHAAAAVSAVLHVLHAHRDDAPVQHEGCMVLHILARTECLQQAVDAGRVGAVPSVVAALRAHPGSCDVQTVGVLALVKLCEGGRAGNLAAQDAAVRCGAREHAGLVGRTAEHAQLFAQLQAALANAVRRHDAAPCAHAAACERCAAARARGEMCSLPSCGARACAAGKKLLRCARCQQAPYCCPEHQRADWASRHKAECREPQAGSTGASRSGDLL